MNSQKNRVMAVPTAKTTTIFGLPSDDGPGGSDLCTTVRRKPPSSRFRSECPGLVLLSAALGIDGVPLSARRSQHGKRNQPFEEAADNDRQMVKVYLLSGKYRERMS